MSGISFKELVVWQKAKQVAIQTYKATESLPHSEVFGLTGQMRRASISISSNIAEGHMRRHRAEKIQFLRIAYGSGAELESQIFIAKELSQDCSFAQIESCLSETMKILNTMIQTYERSR